MKKLFIICAILTSSANLNSLKLPINKSLAFASICAMSATYLYSLHKQTNENLAKSTADFQQRQAKFLARKKIIQECEQLTSTILLEQFEHHAKRTRPDKVKTLENKGRLLKIDIKSEIATLQHHDALDYEERLNCHHCRISPISKHAECKTLDKAIVQIDKKIKEKGAQIDKKLQRKEKTIKVNNFKKWYLGFSALGILSFGKYLWGKYNQNCTN